MKCGDPELDKGIKTTNLAAAYTTEEGKDFPQIAYVARKRAVEQELLSWSGPYLKILRILVTAGTSTSHFKFVYQGQNRCEEYYLRCDGRHTGILFGSDWVRLLRAIRGELKGTSVTDLYGRE